MAADNNQNTKHASPAKKRSNPAHNSATAPPAFRRDPMKSRLPDANFSKKSNIDPLQSNAAQRIEHYKKVTKHRHDLPQKQAAQHQHRHWQGQIQEHVDLVHGAGRIDFPRVTKTAQ